MHEAEKSLRAGIPHAGAQRRPDERGTNATMNATRHSTNSRSRRVYIGAALCASLAVFAAPAYAAGGHLYQQVGFAIERFPLVHGIPQSQPDLTIAHYGGLIAVANDGTVYAMKVSRRGFNGYVIYAFAPGQTTPNRSIVLPHQAPCSLLNPPVQGLSVDALGNLFVLIKYSLSGARPLAPVRTRASFPVCLGVAVYSPVASGQATPIQAIQVSDYYFGGMAVSSRDDLYVNLYDSAQTDEYVNAVQHPVQTRMMPAGLNIAITTDRSGSAYMLDDASGGQAHLDVFDLSWVSGPPTRTIQLPSLFAYPSNAAIRGSFLYVNEMAKSGPGAVGVFEASASGSVNPLGTLNVDNLEAAMAVGP